MKPVEEQSHYDVLEIPVTAGREDIERAYPLVRSAYEPGALASYSVFESDEVAQICERIDAAYRVLMDEESRERYDTLLGFHSEERALERAPEVELPPMGAGASETPSLEDLEGYDDVEVEEEGEWDGARLRRARLRRGVEISGIADVTKISPNYLRAIEDSAYRDLPAAVYTRGFVTAYAREIDIDPEPVVRDFMASFEEARSERRRGRLLSGRR